MNARCFEDDYPEWPDYEQIELGRIEVAVEDIIGTSDAVKESYDQDFQPVPSELNSFRFQKALQFVKDKKRKGGKGILKAIDLGDIHLMRINNKFYVCNDGNRRVAASKICEIEYIFADVTWLRKKR